MGSNWKTARLLDQYEVRSGLSKPAKDFGTGYPFLTFKDVFYNYFTPEVLGDLVESTDKERDGCSVKRGDVFLTRTSETMNELGMSCVALKDYEGATFNGFCKRLRPNEQCELVPEYVGYYLRSPKFRQAMVAFSTMSTRASLNNEMIGRLEISYPPKEAQRHIAHVLKTLDNKITLNRQINQTLEQMAQTLFKSWFVDFDPVIDNALDAGNPIPDELQHRAEARKVVRESEGFKPLPDEVRQQFPDAFEESELGWVPKGWGVQRLDVTLDLAYGKALKKTDRIDGDVPVYGSGGVNGTHNVSIVDGPGIIVGRKGTVGSLYWEPNNFYPIDTVFYVKPKSGYSMEYCYELLKTLGLEHMNTDAAVPGLNRNNAYRLVSAKPTPELIELFTQNASVYRSRISHCCSESNTLTKLRDTLLPKLISGELRLDEVELAVEQETVSAEQQNER
ncbi:restriction endonuclease subunit S [Vibrio cholerae]|nr:restriction endonuclease subunit S [Vibrio cholerae]EHS1092334.1 restriction endonuclease subunit S [Vibrio cholerae]EJH6264782.1 restriction endonuclease subunit S [Vibrio cholerae]EJL6419353.1 restriction endonuclease subunit S [Vibrio cholerae]EJL6498264.1 restriction endonuclease subunit S [Vibrio cholerae]